MNNTEINPVTQPKRLTAEEEAREIVNDNFRTYPNTKTMLDAIAAALRKRDERMEKTEKHRDEIVDFCKKMLSYYETQFN
jgi:hypothetical protein